MSVINATKSRLSLKFQGLRSIALVCCLCFLHPAFSQNPIMLQGTSAWLSDNYLLLKGLDRSLMRIGIAKFGYRKTDGSVIPAGPWTGKDSFLNGTSTDFRDNESLSLQLLRFGVRGHIAAHNVDYLALFEAGDNMQSELSGTLVTPAEWSLTLNDVFATRTRIGQFRYPGGLEGHKGPIDQHYVYLSNPTNVLLLERYFDGDGTNPRDENAMNGPPSGFTDIGIQFFDQIEHHALEHTYAFMLGQGNGINRGDNNSNKDVYLYYSAEKAAGGIGHDRQGIRGFAWYQYGKRRLTDPAEAEYDRKRAGIGVRYRMKRWRIESEAMKANGMIISGTDGGAIPGETDISRQMTASYNLLPDGFGNGWYLDIGYFLTPALSVGVRLDKTTISDSRDFRLEQTNDTIGLEYFLSESSKITVNYEGRSASFPKQPSNSIQNRILSDMDDRISVQLTLLNIQ